MTTPSNMSLHGAEFQLGMTECAVVRCVDYNLLALMDHDPLVANFLAADDMIVFDELLQRMVDRDNDARRASCW